MEAQSVNSPRVYFVFISIKMNISISFTGFDMFNEFSVYMLLQLLAPQLSLDVFGLFVHYSLSIRD